MVVLRSAFMVTVVIYLELTFYAPLFSERFLVVVCDMSLQSLHLQLLVKSRMN